ncbi:MucR family transcriptional regulator [Mesorhizobium yinganensis]|uniref:MucR family transcriptional regulator n=1 Tax=Mesorhizobium yinganensis TaxID=3157707 RepID=UPI0032B8384D
MSDNDDLVQLTADIVSAYVSNNPTPTTSLPDLIAVVNTAMRNLTPISEPEPVILVPAVPVKKSITPDYLVCLEDGKKFTSLKRHLATSFDLSPDEYRKKWNLPPDYPMVAPNYAAKRSELAKTSGLGRKAAPPPPAPKKRGRPAKR